MRERGLYNDLFYPIIASFFRNIGYADQLGSGVRNLFKYSKFYSGKDPEFKEGDIFRITVPLDDEFSYDFGNSNEENAVEVPAKCQKVPGSARKMPENELSEQEKLIIELLRDKGRIVAKDVEQLLDVKGRRVRTILFEMVQKGLLEKQGTSRATTYVLKQQN